MIPRSKDIKVSKVPTSMAHFRAFLTTSRRQYQSVLKHDVIGQLI